MNALAKLAAGILLPALLVHPTLAAVVTMTRTPGVTRTQTQGAGTYNVYDFFWTNASGAEFTNYTVTGALNFGSFFDPARLQDHRQTNPPAAGQDGNTAGAVDMWANTVWSSTGKTDIGVYGIFADPDGYAPSGSGASPAFTNFKWDVFDTVMGDDNDLNNDRLNPTSATAPYHIMRVLTSLDTSGSISFLAYDTSSPGVAFTYSFFLSPGGPGLRVDDLDLGKVTRGTIVTARLPGGISGHGWTLESFTAPNGPVVGATVDFNTGEFSWDSSGAALGGYSAVIRDSHFEAGTDTGTLTFNLIPEPSSVTLCAFAMLGTFSAIRRRSI